MPGFASRHVCIDYFCYGICQHWKECTIVIDDIVYALDRRNGVVLVLLVLTAAFDTVDHAMLLQQMYSIGIRGPTLAWLSSHLYNRTMAIKTGDAISRQRHLCCVVVCRRDRFLGPCCLLSIAYQLAPYSPNTTLRII